MRYKQHLFICTNSKKSTNTGCAAKGAEQLRLKVKEDCRALGKDVRINASGCLGACEEGIAAVLYPEGHFMTNLSEDSNEMLTQLVKAKIGSD